MEALKERGILTKNVPHLVHKQRFIIPIYKWWDGPFYTLDMKIYDTMASTLEDMLARRFRTLFLDAKSSMEMARPVAEAMAREMGKDSIWGEAQVKEYMSLAKSYTVE